MVNVFNKGKIKFLYYCLVGLRQYIPDTFIFQQQVLVYHHGFILYLFRVIFKGLDRHKRAKTTFAKNQPFCLRLFSGNPSFHIAGGKRDRKLYEILYSTKHPL